MDIEKLQQSKVRIEKLAKRIAATVRRFTERYPEGTPVDLMMAFDMLLANTMLTAKTKEKAFELNEENCRVIREMLEKLPDSAFGKGVKEE